MAGYGASCPDPAPGAEKRGFRRPAENAGAFSLARPCAKFVASVDAGYGASCPDPARFAFSLAHPCAKSIASIELVQQRG
jgi:hypothetical protein